MSLIDNRGMSIDFLERICNLEEENKKLKMRYWRISEDLDKTEEKYKNYLKLIFTASVSYIHN